jgi:hypothetical protein
LEENVTINLYIYDDKCKTLTRPFDASTTDDSGVVLDSAVCKRLGAEWGAKLNTGGSSPDVYNAIVLDPKMAYSPFYATHHNGVSGGRIDAVMMPLPASGYGGGPTTSGGIDAYIDMQGWTPAEKAGARRLCRAFATFDRFRRVSPQWTDWLDSWADRLRLVNINPKLLESRHGE